MRKTGLVIKDKNGKDVLKVWEELLSQRENSELELPSVVEGQPTTIS